jgi:hypothetical protein
VLLFGRHTAAEALRKLDEIQAPVAKLSLTTTEIKESFDTFVATDKSESANPLPTFR